jgi:predicted unusual protein kinase regulating ubiquinone biosynthesis (AarF/ABC1/UbiB family)
MLTILHYYTLYKFNLLDEKLKHKSFQKKFRKDISNSGIISIKIAQWMSHRSDLFSSSLINSLKPLVNYVPNIHPFSWTKHVIEKSLHKKYFTFFESISESVLGSGSISQVYQCKIIDDNRKFVVKVHHKDIRSHFVLEKNYWKKIIWTLQIFRTHNAIDIHGFIDSIETQLSYEHEFKNFKFIKEITDEISFVKLPSIVHVFKDFLVMTYEKGYSYSELEQYYPEYLVDMSKKLLISYFWMVYKGKIHCDLHDGNSLYVIDDDDDSENKLIILDFGLCFSLDSYGKNGIAFLLWKAFVTQNDATIHSLLKHILINTNDLYSKIKKIDPFYILSHQNELSFIDWLENILYQLSCFHLQMQTIYMYVFMGFIILGRSFSLKNKITGKIENFDVFGSSLQEMKKSGNPEIAKIGKEFYDDFISFSYNTKTKEKINSHITYFLN